MDILLHTGSIVLGLLILVLLVVVHELGHAIAARRNGVVVEEFGIGFPPRAWSRKLKNGVLFTLNWLPLGGFVKLQGEHDAADKKGDYGAATFWQKTKILLAGVIINWLTAVVIFAVLALVGLPKVLPDQFQMTGDSTEQRSRVKVATVVHESPAEQSGIKKGDEIVRFAGQRVETTDAFYRLTETNKGKEVEVVFIRDGKERTAEARLHAERSDKGFFGVAPLQSITYRSTWSAPIVGFATTVQFSWATLEGLGTTLGQLGSGLVSQLNPNSQVRQQGGEALSAAGESVAGPIGILGLIFPAAVEAGPSALLFFTAIISLTLAIMNVLPIPALDGGRWFVTAVYRLLKKPLSKEREERIHATGFMLLMGLVVLVTIADVTKLL